MSDTTNLTPEHATIRELSDRIVELQKPIRILDAIKWDEQIKAEFFKHKCQKLPSVTKEYYANRPLSYEPEDLIIAFHQLKREINNKLGQYSLISKMMTRLCSEYGQAINMLMRRGTPSFSQLAMELYGAPDDVFYPGGPKLSDFGVLLGDTFAMLSNKTASDADIKRYSAAEAAKTLDTNLSTFFESTEAARVIVSDDIIADAAAGADCIRLNSNVMFSERDLRYLEVHEGWVHIGTTLNGHEQPICTFLSKGSPSSSITQEGLAVITEIFSFSSYPRRMQRITNRIRALSLANEGANFIDIYRFFLEHGLDENESYSSSVRLFRGSLPDSGPFTKDLSYAKGFILIYNFIRLAVQQGNIDMIPLFFVGKTLIEDIPAIYELRQQNIISDPKYLPPQFKDLAALSSWMGFSLYLNKFDLEAVNRTTI